METPREIPQEKGLSPSDDMGTSLLGPTSQTPPVFPLREEIRINELKKVLVTELVPQKELLGEIRDLLKIMTQAWTRQEGHAPNAPSQDVYEAGPSSLLQNQSSQNINLFSPAATPVAMTHVTPKGKQPESFYSQPKISASTEIQRKTYIEGVPKRAQTPEIKSIPGRLCPDSKPIALAPGLPAYHSFPRSWYWNPTMTPPIDEQRVEDLTTWQTSVFCMDDSESSRLTVFLEDGTELPELYSAPIMLWEVRVEEATGRICYLTPPRRVRLNGDVYFPMLDEPQVVFDIPPAVAPISLQAHLEERRLAMVTSTWQQLIAEAPLMPSQIPGDFKYRNHARYRLVERQDTRQQTLEVAPRIPSPEEPPLEWPEPSRVDQQENWEPTMTPQRAMADTRRISGITGAQFPTLRPRAPQFPSPGSLASVPPSAGRGSEDPRHSKSFGHQQARTFMTWSLQGSGGIPEENRAEAVRRRRGERTLPPPLRTVRGYQPSMVPQDIDDGPTLIRHQTVQESSQNPTRPTRPEESFIPRISHQNPQTIPYQPVPSPPRGILLNDTVPFQHTAQPQNQLSQSKYAPLKASEFTAFNPEKTDWTIDDFCDEIGANAAYYPPREVAMLIPKLLRGPALTWWANLLPAHRTQLIGSDWETWKIELIRTFRTREYEEELQRKVMMSKFRDSDNDPFIFAQNMIKWNRRLYYDQATNTTIIRSILNAFPRDAAHALRQDMMSYPGDHSFHEPNYEQIPLMWFVQLVRENAANIRNCLLLEQFQKERAKKKVSVVDTRSSSVQFRNAPRGKISNGAGGSVAKMRALEANQMTRKVSHQNPDSTSEPTRVRLRRQEGYALNGSKLASSSACYRCGQDGHFSRDCPTFPGKVFIVDFDDIEEKGKIEEVQASTPSFHAHVMEHAIIENNASVEEPQYVFDTNFSEQEQDEDGNTREYIPSDDDDEDGDEESVSDGLFLVTAKTYLTHNHNPTKWQDSKTKLLGPTLPMLYPVRKRIQNIRDYSPRQPVQFTALMGTTEKVANLIYDSGSGVSLLHESTLRKVEPKAIIQSTRRTLTISGIGGPTAAAVKGVVDLQIILMGTRPCKVTVRFVVMTQIDPRIIIIGTDWIHEYGAIYDGLNRTISLGKGFERTRLTLTTPESITIQRNDFASDNLKNRGVPVPTPPPVIHAHSLMPVYTVYEKSTSVKELRKGSSRNPQVTSPFVPGPAYLKTARVSKNINVAPGKQAFVPLRADEVFHQPHIFIPHRMKSLNEQDPNHVAQAATTIVDPRTGCLGTIVMNLDSRQLRLEEGRDIGYFKPIKYIYPVKFNPDTSQVFTTTDLTKLPQTRRRPAEEQVSWTPAEREIFEKDVIEAVHINPELSDKEKESLIDLIWRRARAFAFRGNDLGQPQALKWSIETGQIAPISEPPRRLSPAKTREADIQIQELLQLGVIEPSTSPWAAPIVMAPKKDKGWRMCIDFRRLNTITTPDQYPIPRIEDIFNALNGSIYKSSLDANRGFHQLLPVTESDKLKTAFRSPSGGLYQYKRMPFGIRNGPAIFQRFMDLILGHYKWTIALVYIDDVIVFSKTFEEHIERLNTILSLFEQASFTLSPKKCNFGFTSISALGYQISSIGLATEEEKIRKIKEFPVPVDLASLRSFLGLASYYRRFIHHFSQRVGALNLLLRKDVPFSWGEAQQSAFEDIRNALCVAPILAFPDYTRPFVLQTDASHKGLGAVLLQKDKNTKVLRPVIFLSKSLAQAQTRYSATELECLAVHWALRDQLAHILDGVEFELQTDHKALQALFSLSTTNPRLQAWAVDLEPFRPFMKITYNPGKSNECADALSRYPGKSASEAPAASGELDTYFSNSHIYNTLSTPGQGIYQLFAPKSKSPNDLLVAAFMARVTDEDLPHPFLERIRRAQVDARLILDQHTAQGVDKLYRRRDSDAIIIPSQDRDLVNSILWEFHDSPAGAHLGRDKLTAILKKRFYWESMRDDISQYVKTCASCQRNKPSNQLRIGRLVSLPVPPRPFHTVSTDFLTGLPTSSFLYKEEFDAIMVVVDLFSKYTLFIPLRKDATSETVAWIFYAHVVLHWGLPHKIVSDRDPKFTSDFWIHLWKAFGTRLSPSTPRHPQTDGQTERANRTLEEMLRHFCSSDQKSWAKWLPILQLAYNSSKHAGTTFSPQFLLYGFHADTPSDLILGPDVPNTPGTKTLYYHTRELNSLRELARKSIVDAQSRMAHYHNKHRRDETFKEGDLVLIDIRGLPGWKSTDSVPKLDPRYRGPFKIIEVISSHAYRLDIPTDWQIHPVISIEYLKPFFSQNLTEFPQRPLVVPDIGNPPDEEKYEIECIIDRKKISRREKNKRTYPEDDDWKYQIRWKNYGPEEDQWIGESVLRESAADLADQYDQQYPKGRVASTKKGTTVRDTSSTLRRSRRTGTLPGNNTTQI